MYNGGRQPRISTNMRHRTIAILSTLVTAAILSSCGQDEARPVAGVDPAVRQAAIEKLQQQGLEFSPEAFIRELKGSSRAEVLQLYLDAGLSARGATRSGETLLMLLVRNGTDKEAVVKSAKLLIEHGANVKAADRTGKTVLHYAVSRSNPELVKLLIDAGVDVNAKDRRGSTVMENTFNSEIVDMLKAAGAKEKPLPPSLNF